MSGDDNLNEDQFKPAAIPTHAIFQGTKVRVLHYERDGYFRVLHKEGQRSVHRDRLRFLK